MTAENVMQCDSVLSDEILALPTPCPTRPTQKVSDVWCDDAGVVAVAPSLHGARTPPPPARQCDATGRVLYNVIVAHAHAYHSHLCDPTGRMSQIIHKTRLYECVQDHIPG